MRTLAILSLSFALTALAPSLAAQDGMRFRLEIEAATHGAVDVDAELGKRFAADFPAEGAPMRLEGEIVRSSLARGREVLDVEVTVSRHDSAQWQRIAATTLKLHVGRRGEASVADAAGEAFEIAALATRL